MPKSLRESLEESYNDTASIAEGETDDTLIDEGISITDSEDSGGDEPPIDKEPVQETKEEKPIKKASPRVKPEKAIKPAVSEEGEKPEPEKFLDPIIPPTAFNTEQKASFKKLPRQSQEAISNIYKSFQSDYTKKTQDVAQRAKYVKDLHEALSPHRDRLAVEGRKPKEVVSRVLSWDKALRGQTEGLSKEYAAVQFLQHYGVDARAIMDPQNAAMYHPAQQAQQQQPGEFKDPRVDALLQQQQAQVIAALGQIEDDWKSETDAGGNLLRPYVEELQPIMERYLPALKQAVNINTPDDIRRVFDKAYQLAITDNPDIQESINQRNAAFQKAKQIKQAEEAAKKAGRLAISPKGGSGGGTPSKKRSIRESLESAYEG